MRLSSETRSEEGVSKRNSGARDLLGKWQEHENLPISANDAIVGCNLMRRNLVEFAFACGYLESGSPLCSGANHLRCALDSGCAVTFLFSLQITNDASSYSLISLKIEPIVEQYYDKGICLTRFGLSLLRFSLNFAWIS